MNGCFIIYPNGVRLDMDLSDQLGSIMIDNPKTKESVEFRGFHLILAYGNKTMSVTAYVHPDQADDQSKITTALLAFFLHKMSDTLGEVVATVELLEGGGIALDEAVLQEARDFVIERGWEIVSDHPEAYGKGEDVLPLIQAYNREKES